MLEKGGDVMTKVVPNRHNSTLVKEVRENIIKGSEIHVYVALYGLFRRVYLQNNICNMRELDRVISPTNTHAFGGIVLKNPSFSQPQ